MGALSNRNETEMSTIPKAFFAFPKDCIPQIFAITRSRILPEEEPLPHLVILTEGKNLPVTGSVAPQTNSRFLNSLMPFRNDNRVGGDSRLWFCR